MQPQPSHSLLAGHGLTRSYRLGSTVVPAVVGVDIEVWPGDLIVLQGPSGSGKTTLINMLGLLDRPDSGSLALNGQLVDDLGENARADLRRNRYGFVFQTFNLVPVLSAVENVEYPLRLSGVAAAARRRRAEALLAAVGLVGKDRARPDHLSGGQRQRVAIARALANEPEIILADEPTASLDTRSADEVLDLMETINREQGVALVLASHDPRVMERARRVITLCDGRIVGAG